MQQDAFKPQGQQISVVGMSGSTPLAGIGKRMGPVGRSSAPLPMDPMSRGAGVSAKHSVPTNARQVRLMGAEQMQQPSILPDLKAPVQTETPAAPQQVAMGQQQPFLNRQAKDREVVRVSILGRAPDGSEWLAPYDAEFPIGTQVISLKHEPLT
jgi:hypothetical protein